MRAATGRPDTGALVNARVQELLESWRPWHRRLWDVGTVLALREAVEAADWVGSHVLSQGSLAWYARESLLRRLKTDSALGDGQTGSIRTSSVRRSNRGWTRWPARQI
ncbi:hypothetical protein AB0C10_08575 [Microbispora amethystogenes]|uniref:hypothetical protein n=1 Tax=Microbispora amethystogenes TaxID=1427754 RepID=UPI0033D087E2